MRLLVTLLHLIGALVNWHPTSTALVTIVVDDGKQLPACGGLSCDPAVMTAIAESNRRLRNGSSGYTEDDEETVSRVRKDRISAPRIGHSTKLERELIFI